MTACFASDEDAAVRFERIKVALTRLAKEKGIANGEKVRISSARGTVDAVAMVTVRLTPFKCGGKTVHQVGMTFNYGWLQPKECGDTANLLSPMVGDANSMTPEYKAFMVNIDKIKA